MEAKTLWLCTDTATTWDQLQVVKCNISSFYHVLSIKRLVFLFLFCPLHSNRIVLQSWILTHQIKLAWERLNNNRNSQCVKIKTQGNWLHIQVIITSAGYKLCGLRLYTALEPHWKLVWPHVTWSSGASDEVAALCLWWNWDTVLWQHTTHDCNRGYTQRLQKIAVWF